MSDDLWAALKQYAKSKRCDMLQHSLAQLAGASISFTTHNNGAHLKLECYAKNRTGKLVVDFWPSTGLWIVQASDPPLRQRSVEKLITFINKCNACKPSTP